MRRAVGHIEKVRPGVFRVTVMCGRDPSTGKRRRKSQTIRGTRHDAEAAIPRLLLEAGHSSPGVAKMTLADYVERTWLPSLDLRTPSIESYTRRFAVYITPYVGGIPLDRLRPYDLDAWLKRLKAGGLSASTVANAYRVLRIALRQAVRWQIIERCPLDSVPAPSVRPRELTVLSPEEAQAYLDHFAGHRVELAVVLALAAGLRRSEIAGLEWRDIDFALGIASIRRSRRAVKGGVETFDTKTARSRRDIALPSWAMERLRAKRAFGPVVPGHPDAMAGAYTRHLRDSKLRYIPLRDLRHSHATLLLAAGVDVVTVSRRLGHASVLTTDSFYLRPGMAADRIAAEKAEGIGSRGKSGNVRGIRTGTEGAEGDSMPVSPAKTPKKRRS